MKSKRCKWKCKLSSSVFVSKHVQNKPLDLGDLDVSSWKKFAEGQEKGTICRGKNRIKTGHGNVLPQEIVAE